MLQSAIALIDCVEHEQIVLMRCLVCALAARLGAMPEADFGLANLLRIGQQTLAIKTGGCTRDDKAVRHATGDEGAAPEHPQLHRRVHQFVVISGQVTAKTTAVDFFGRKAGGGVPVRQLLFCQQR